jgi:MFS transporter, DHA1 family, tetracycline resistance protein
LDTIRRSASLLAYQLELTLNFKELDRRIITIFLIVFVQILGASLALPILPLYAQRYFDLSPQAITLLVSSFFAAQFVAGPFLGRLSDRYGRLPILILSQVGTAISFLMLGLSNSVWMLYAARIFDGITGGNIIVAQAYITDITPRDKRAQSLGYLMAAFGLGFIFGPALGGLLSAIYGPRIPFILAAIAAALVAAMTWFTLDETVTPEMRARAQHAQRSSFNFRSLATNVPLLLVLLIAFVGQFGLGILQATFALYGEAVLFVNYSDDATNIGIGLLLAVIGLTQFITQLFILRRLLARFGEAVMVVAGIVVRMIGLIIYAVISSPYLGAFGSIFFALGMGIMMPPLQALATETADDSNRGGILGVFQSVASLSTIFSTAIGGVIFAINPRLPYWTAVMLSLVVLMPAIYLWRQHRHVPLQPKPASTVS